MKITFSYHYVNDGDLNPDKLGRWRIDVYMQADIKKDVAACDGYLGKNKFMHIRLASICQKGCTNGRFPNSSERFYIEMPTFDDATNFGMTIQCFKSDDIEVLKKIVRKQFNKVESFFINCKK